ncbi:MAG: leucine-rich repeat domain-containing protein [Spirochaetales bacterium]|nr:leucine-rich repeat domain-containing protein [Spirochaetales bacterium]
MKTKVKILLFSYLIFDILSSCSLLTEYVTIGPLTYTKINDGTEFKLYYCDRNYSGEINIASEVDGIPVTTIGDAAFSECTGLTGNLIIPDSITSIGKGAFYQCSGFTGSITFPSNIKSIGDCVFYKCYNLTGDLIIPKSVISIGNSAFESTRFTGIDFPSSLITIGDFAFRRCWYIDSITFPPNISYIGVEAFLYTSLDQIYCEALIAPELGDADQWARARPVHVYQTAIGYDQGNWIYFNIIADL